MDGKTGARWGGRLVLALLVLSWAVTAAPARADEPAKESMEEERGKLEKEAQELNNQAVQLYQGGKYAAATELLEKALVMRRHLYPADKYPDGQPELADILNNLGVLLEERGEYPEAEADFRDALEMRKHLFPPSRFPDGHPDLAESLTNLGFLLEERGEYAEAEPFYRDALEMCKRLYPPDKYPDGHPDLAESLKKLGALLEERGEYSQAEPLYRDALEMCKRLYPPDKYPDGHPDLAQSLNNLGALLQKRGEYAEAEPLYRGALAMYRRLYPADKYPDGHPDLAQSLNNLGALLQKRGEYAEAEPFSREALDMYQHLYPADKYPDGHPDLATSLNNLGALLDARSEYSQAEPLYRDALEMCKRLYPPDKYPDGHPDLAQSLNNLGELLGNQGKYAEAEPLYRGALAMYRRLYPADKYPDGHPDLAQSLNNLGELLYMRGEYVKSTDALAEGAAMYDRLTVAFAERGAEAEALNLEDSLPGTRIGFLVASGHAEAAHPARDYAVLWPSKAAIARVLEHRRRLLCATAAADAKTRDKLEELQAAREDLARLISAPVRPGDADREKLLRDLTDRKERLEKELSDVLPPSGRETPPYTELVEHLSEHAAFVDLYGYLDWDSKTHKWADPHYAVFVLRKGRPVRRVELADAVAIAKDLKQWRQDIVKGFAGDAAGRLRKSVWEPIAQAMGDGVDTVYICPDGDLAALPWSALPGDRDGRVLLEGYTFATVPSGLFLLEQFTHPAPADRGAGVLLAVGGVRYDRDGVTAGKPWPALPATDKERAAVAAQARKLAKPPEFIDRTGADADVAHLLHDLPRARWAHLATHGFFAAKDTQEREHLFRPGDFAFGLTPLGGRLDRRGAAARNPLTASGLVLAGANQPTEKDPGLLTGEAIAGLDLDGMDLAVLSACQTGLGEADLGEGVFGLQRAFHIAGAKNVVASLWTVDDDATAALMNLFYYHLWEKNEPPLEALHHAQLELYRNPQGVPALARGRGAADWDETVQVVTKPPADPKESPKRPAAVRDWAAFVLSGAGR